MGNDGPLDDGAFAIGDDQIGIADDFAQRRIDLRRLRVRYRRNVAEEDQPHRWPAYKPPLLQRAEIPSLPASDGFSRRGSHDSL